MSDRAQTTDLELLARWRDGDGVAGDALIGRHFDAVRRYFQAHLRSSRHGTEPSDLAQRTFELCIAGRDRVRSDFRAYLFGIARHVLIREWKHRRGLGEVVTPSEAGVQDDGTSPSRKVAKLGEQRMLLDILYGMPPEYSSVLVRRFWEGHGLAEIAEELGVAVGTVKSRIFRGKAMLRERLAEMAVPPAVLEGANRRLDRELDEQG